jgi:tryptophan halogenase
MIEFNRQSDAEAECARDYVIAHYKMNSLGDNAFWTACRNMAVPDSLSHRIDVYKNCGRVVMLDGEIVDRFNWITLFDAGGLRPEQYDVVARSLPNQLINEHLAAIRQTLLGTVASLPSYQSYLSGAGR